MVGVMDHATKAGDGRVLPEYSLPLPGKALGHHNFPNRGGIARRHNGPDRRLIRATVSAHRQRTPSEHKGPRLSRADLSCFFLPQISIRR